MKKSALIAVLGFTIGVASSYAQGAIKFDSYNNNGGIGTLTTFLVGGAPLAAGYTANLVYSLSPITDSAGNGPISGSWLSPATSVATPFLTGGAAGYFAGPNFQLPGYTAGATVYFEILAYQTSAGSYANSTAERGHSDVIATTLATGTTLAPFLNWAPFTVSPVAPVPEPTTLALAGLGGLASLVMLRRKNA